MHFAIQCRNVKAVQRLLEHGANPNQCMNISCTHETSKKSPLHLACQTGNFEMVKILLEHGADLNARTSSGLTPIHMALKLVKSINVITGLLKKEPDLNTKSKNGDTPVHDARTLMRLGVSSYCPLLCSRFADP